jgi:hypothetical protein
MLEGNTHDAQFSDKGVEKMLEGALLYHLYEFDWVDWEIDGHHLGYIPFDLHGNHSPMAHHCMLKEAHNISYI